MQDFMVTQILFSFANLLQIIYYMQSATTELL